MDDEPRSFLDHEVVPPRPTRFRVTMVVGAVIGVLVLIGLLVSALIPLALIGHP